MKLKWNEKYNTIAVYSFIVIGLSIILYTIVSQVNVFKIQISRYISIFSPIIIGFIMAYIFNFILEFYEENIVENLFKKTIRKEIEF